jgi:hypothetical protein
MCQFENEHQMGNSIFKLINFQIKTMSGIYIHIPFASKLSLLRLLIFDFHEKKKKWCWL